MSAPLFVSQRTKPKITTQPLSVDSLIFDRESSRGRELHACGGPGALIRERSSESCRHATQISQVAFCGAYRIGR
jgi:hypothetical protein